MSKENKTEKRTVKFNQTVTAMFQNNNFGKGSYISKPLTETDIEVLRSMKVGQSLLLKATGKETSYGNQYAFLEVLLPKSEKQALQEQAAEQNSDL